MAVSVGHVPFPDFFNIGNNYKYCSISGVFSLLGAPRKVIDTFLESSTHVGPIIGYAISRIFQRGVIIPKIVAFHVCSLHLGQPRKVVDTDLESATHGGENKLYAISRIFQHRE